MFHPFRQHQKRKVHSHSSGGHKDQNDAKGMAIPTLPLKLFMQQDELEQKQQQRPDLLLRDDSSADLSVYTTDTKTTVQYPPRDPYGRMNSAEWPSKRASAYAAKATTAVAQESNLLGSSKKEEGNRSQSPKTITGTRLNEWMVTNTSRSRSSSPSTAPSTPPRDVDHTADDDEEVEDYYDYDHRIQERRQRSLASGSVSRVSSNPTTQELTARDRVKHWRGPVDLDDSSIEDEDSSSEDLDDDDAVVAEAEDENVRHALVFRTKMAPSNILPEDSDNEARLSPMVWTDHDEDDDGISKLVAPPRKLSDEDAEALNRSYNETMQSISFHSIDENKEYDGYGGEDGGYCSDDMDSGAVLLTQEELEKHLSKVQSKEPMPSSYIGGYDQWKQEQEYKRRYFERLQRKVNEKKRHQQPHKLHHQLDQSPRRPAQSPGAHCNRSAEDSLAGCTRYTYGHMDKSVASTIATAQTKESSVHQEKPSETAAKSKTKRRWKILPKLTGSSNKKYPSKKNEKVHSRHTSPPRESAPKRVEEPSEVANMSLAPLNTMLGMDVGSLGEPKELVSQYLQEERKKQLQAEEEQAQEEWREQERIQRKKEQYLQRQRELNNIGLSGPRCTSPSPISPYASKDSKEDGTAPMCCASFESGRSGARSTTVLSPCILCDDAERTHIAMPCMHFFFCGSCVEKMTQNCKCPVCGVGNVHFARVYTG
mmetsp:Transcript_40417/g.97556  ORF Transcript_40417/g.97556 Transcript_40417/m.97556 type:complete len:708 (+) Transcript_40417:201-2324(+)|eukprot:CAMPEP_0113634842 /NCGR_PEP_ID=MMETSP0017_2-20120614/18150_1 /TAXON_ID=2856 /ORGANISM="Cylindrotheca closterium" /LENGTH=707 /DNA_ID=CAMNT_0000545573 /DNA_START=195 /DNA_END=2318 /DNA_ORIENTATION=- /assembly_acc=CAM_ASM_000147